MAADITEIQAMVVRKIQDKAAFLSTAAGTGDLEALINEAVKQYSRNRPQVIVEDESGDGGFDYPLTGQFTGIAFWEKGFSEIRKVIYPRDDASATENVLDEDDYTIVTRISASVQDDYLRFLSAVPVATEKYRIFYTARHVVDATSSTVPAADDEAIANLASAFACEAISSRYAGTKKPSLDADSVDYADRSQQYRLLAQRFWKSYAAHLGIPVDGTREGQSALVDLDLNFQWQRPFLFHGSRGR